MIVNRCHEKEAKAFVFWLLLTAAAWELHIYLLVLKNQNRMWLFSDAKLGGIGYSFSYPPKRPAETLFVLLLLLCPVRTH